MMAENGWYDFFLIDPDSNIVFTVMEESDLGMNITNSELAGSSMGQAFSAAQTAAADQVVMSDFAAYAPSNGDQAAFMVSAITDSAGRTDGYVAIQIPTDEINAILQERAGMGETGETYLVGPNNRMRSDSFLDPENRSVAASFAGTVADNGVDTVASRAALAGNSGQEIIIDYNSNPVLSAYDPIQVYDTQWAILAEIDQAEAFAAR
jgi:methyl-accepting chemotaxis protein